MKQLHVKDVQHPDPDNPGKAIHIYTVTKVTNAVTPHIGDYLEADALEHFCTVDDWTVTIT